MIGRMVALARQHRVFRAIADPARRAILTRLAREGAKPALALGKGFRASQPALSKHLKVLRDAGLVRTERAGRQRIYELEPEPLRAVDEWIATYRRFWTEKLDALGRHLEEKR
jgi:DNA-binding transcriptional ArsR family regulator